MIHGTPYLSVIIQLLIAAFSLTQPNAIQTLQNLRKSIPTNHCPRSSPSTSDDPTDLLAAAACSSQNWKVLAAHQTNPRNRGVNPRKCQASSNHPPCARWRTKRVESDRPGQATRRPLRQQRRLWALQAFWSWGVFSCVFVCLIFSCHFLQ